TNSCTSDQLPPWTAPAFRWLLNRKVAWLLAAKNAIDIRRSEPEYVQRIGSIRHKPACADNRAICASWGKAVSLCRCGDQFVMRDRCPKTTGVSQYEAARCIISGSALEGFFWAKARWVQQGEL